MRRAAILLAVAAVLTGCGGEPEQPLEVQVVAADPADARTVRLLYFTGPVADDSGTDGDRLVKATAATVQEEDGGVQIALWSDQRASAEAVFAVEYTACATVRLPRPFGTAFLRALGEPSRSFQERYVEEAPGTDTAAEREYRRKVRQLERSQCPAVGVRQP